MSNLVQRTLSGAVYVGLVVASILVHPAFFGGLFLIVTLLAIRELHKIIHSSTFLTVAAMIAGGLLFAIAWAWSWGYAGQTADLALRLLLFAYMPILMAAMVAELYLKQENPIHNWGALLSSQAMIALPFALMNGIMAINKYALLALFITIWVNDSGAYCVGSLSAKRKGGNHKMFPRISPAKSWEGLIGGFVFALIGGYIYYAVGWIDNLNLSLGLALAIAIFGTFGDLMESLMKRTVGIKDSGKFMPGHGGVLDRFDSILLATPIAYILLIAFA
ncbi:MAG: phosphatidate cytidylyltransferase [Paludibacteraceae bacterium]|nr:phosphatidate cytidylyltransferase [Paludibacteraceae bacterium]